MTRRNCGIVVRHDGGWLNLKNTFVELLPRKSVECLVVKAMDVICQGLIYRLRWEDRVSPKGKAHYPYCLYVEAVERPNTCRLQCSHVDKT